MTQEASSPTVLRIRQGSVITVKGRGHKKWLVVECPVDLVDWDAREAPLPLLWLGCRPVVVMTARRRNDPWLERMALRDATGRKVYVGEAYWSGCSLSDIERVVRF